MASVAPRGTLDAGTRRSRHDPGAGTGISTLESGGLYLPGLGAGAASRTGEGRDRAAHPRLASPSWHRSGITATVLSGASRRSTWNHGTVRGRTDGTYRSTYAHRHHWRTVVRMRMLSPQRRTPVTTVFGQSG